MSREDEVVEIRRNILKWGRQRRRMWSALAMCPLPAIMIMMFAQSVLGNWRIGIVMMVVLAAIGLFFWGLRGITEGE